VKPAVHLSPSVPPAKPPAAKCVAILPLPVEAHFQMKSAPAPRKASVVLLSKMNVVANAVGPGIVVTGLVVSRGRCV
jgi:hypothetical protein